MGENDDTLGHMVGSLGGMQEVIGALGCVLSWNLRPGNVPLSICGWGCHRMPSPGLGTLVGAGSGGGISSPRSRRQLKQNILLKRE